MGNGIPGPLRRVKWMMAVCRRRLTPLRKRSLGDRRTVNAQLMGPGSQGVSAGGALVG